MNMIVEEMGVAARKKWLRLRVGISVLLWDVHEWNGRSPGWPGWNC